jgi:hypothetical protein
MLFFIAAMIIIFGVMLTGISSLLPIESLIYFPYVLRITFFMVGVILVFLGLSLISGRAKKTGANHLLEWGRPDKILWFYVYKDGSIKITPAMREVEGQIYSPELDAQIHEMKSYRLFDHSVRFVPEGVGHAVDLGLCLYASFLKTKHGFDSLRHARRSFFNKFGIKTTRPVDSQEEVMEFEE